MDSNNASTTPAANPPPGVVPNFIDPPSEKDVIIAYTTIFTIIATFGVAARMYVRLFIIRKSQIEDYLLVVSWAFFMIFNGFVYTQAIASVMGRHAWDVNLVQLEHFLWLLNITTIIYGPMLICGKGALILLWQRIFAGTVNRCALWWFLRVLLYLNIAVYICGMTLQTFICIPRQKIWQPWIDGSCINAEASFLFTAAWNLCLDITLLIIPLFSARNLNIQRKRKWILMGCFALGIVTCVASVLRIVNAVKLAHSDDPIYDEQDSIWSAALEQTGVILVICAPTFPKLWNHFRGRIEDFEEESSHGATSSKRTSSARLASHMTRSELVKSRHSQMSIAEMRQHDQDSDEEKELSYHAIKRNESAGKSMKVHVRSEVTISIAEASSPSPHSTTSHPDSIS